MNNCDLVITLGVDKTVTIPNAISGSDSDQGLVAVANFLTKNKDFQGAIYQNKNDIIEINTIEDLLDCIGRFGNKGIDFDSDNSLANTTLEQIMTSIPIEGGWPDDLPNYIYKEYSKVLYIDAPGYGMEKHGDTLILYRDSLEDFRDNLKLRVSLKRLQNQSYNYDFKAVFEMAKKFREEKGQTLTEIELLEDYLKGSTPDYIVYLQNNPVKVGNVTKDCMTIIKKQMSQILKTETVFDYNNLLLNTIISSMHDKTVSFESLKRGIEGRDDLKLEIISNKDKKVIESLKTYIQEEIAKDPDFPYKLDQFEYDPITKNLKTIRFQRTFPRVEDAIQVDAYPEDLYAFVDKHKGYRIYTRSGRFYVSETPILPSTELKPFNSVKEAKDFIDEQNTKSPIINGSLLSDYIQGDIQDVNKIHSNKLKVGDIIHVLDVEAVEGRSSAFFAWSQMRTRTLSEFQQYLTTLKTSLVKKRLSLSKDISKYKEELAKIGVKDLESLRAVIIKLQKDLLDLKIDDEEVIKTLEVLKSTIFQSKILYSKDLIITEKEYYKGKKKPEGVEYGDKKMINKYGITAVIDSLNKAYTEQGLFYESDIDLILEKIDSIDKCKAFLDRFSTFKNKPIEDIKGIINTISKAKYKYFQVIQKRYGNEYYLIEIDTKKLEKGTKRIYGLEDSTYKEGAKVKVPTTKRDFLDQLVSSIAKKLKGTGYKIELKTAAEIKAMEDIEDADLLELRSQQKGFLTGNTIIINSTYADVTTPIHEFVHVFLGILKANNFETYTKLMQTFANSYRNLDSTIDFYKSKKVYKNLPYIDLLEEIFADHFSFSVINGGMNFLQDGRKEMSDYFGKDMSQSSPDKWLEPILNFAIDYDKEKVKAIPNRRKAANKLREFIKNDNNIEKCE